MDKANGEIEVICQRVKKIQYVVNSQFNGNIDVQPKIIKSEVNFINDETIFCRDEVIK